MLYHITPYTDELVDIFATKEAAERRIVAERLEMLPTGRVVDGVRELRSNRTAAFYIKEKEPIS